jgi:subtilisin family serine protease
MSKDLLRSSNLSENPKQFNTAPGKTTTASNTHKGQRVRICLHYSKPLSLLVLLLMIGSTLTATSALTGENAISKIHPLLLDYFNGKSDARLHSMGGSIHVFVALRPGYDPSTVSDLLSSRYSMSPPGAPLLLYGETTRSSLLSLGSRPGVAHVYPDVKLGFDRMNPDPDVYRQGLASDMYRVREILGADVVNKLGVTGNGVTIAIVDTGTDFTIPDLQHAVARDSSGQAISFDPDGQSFAITSLVVHREGDVLRTKGLSVNVWDAASYVYTSSAIPQTNTVALHYDYGAPTVLSKSGNYHFGIIQEDIQDVVSGGTVTVDFPVVVIDSTTPNVYDTVVVDMSTAYFNFLAQYGGRLNAGAQQTLDINLQWPKPELSWDDHSFADESPHKVGTSDLISFDADGDGIPDFSAGLLAFGIDLSATTGYYYSLLPPIDPNGNFINVFFDFESHGTSTASNAASRGLLKRDIYQNGTLIPLPGIAPDAKVMGVKALWLGDVMFGWYYAAGFDWNPVDFTFRYTGKHRADVISNSWGDSSPMWDLGSTFGADYMSQLADAFALPHYLDPAYPGIIMVIAGGNGGFGYGTTTSPAASTLAITVGASTSYAYRVQPSVTIKHEVAGSYDEIVPWSARGPTSIGEPKPDVVDVGAFGFADQSSFTGYGNGTKAYTVFGGTSMATPVTAGALALLVQEYRNTHNGATPPPDLAKSLLQSGADDLDYDPFTQGSGRVNAFDAVAAAAEGRDPNFPKRFYVQSNATWNSVRKIIENSWALNMGEPLSEEPMSSANWYAGIVSPGSSSSATFSVRNAINPTAQPLQFQLIGTSTYPNSTTGAVSWVSLQKSEIPQGTDLMKVTLVYHFSDFANVSSGLLKNLLVAQIYDVGFNGSLRRINNGAPEGTTSELTVSRPWDKFQGTPRVRILLQSAAHAPVTFELAVRYYKRASWSWITNLQFTGNLLSASLAVPSSAVPGVYGGFIEIADGDSQVMVPVSVMVPIAASGNYGATSTDTPYANYAVYGAFDWSWRYEAGDWRTFALVIPDGVHGVRLRLRWSDNSTNIQAHLTSPSGYLVASSEYPVSKYVGSGEFRWSTSTGGPEEDLSAAGLVPGTYLLVFHNTLFGGESFAQYPEAYNMTVTFY